MVQVESELANYLIDLEDEDCPQFGLHVSAYQSDIPSLLHLLSVPEEKESINSRIRPFFATPLRLAATAGCEEAIQILLEHRADVDLVDVKAQTPLFVALVNQHWGCARLLLESGANPNGNDRNMCTPLSVMAQRGYYEGVKLLCRFGADTEDVYRLMTGMPGLPVAIAATYHHLKCFATLLLFGAKPGLNLVEDLHLPLQVTTQCSVPHAIIRHRCPPEFVYLYREFGGNLWIRDSRQQLATEITNSNSTTLTLMRELQGQALSLMSLCSIVIRSLFMEHDWNKLGLMTPENLEIPRDLCDFLHMTNWSSSMYRSAQLLRPLMDGLLGDNDFPRVGLKIHRTK
ncbi:ankyrin repeat and SOCS box protein 12-like isoform X3 [Tigriopus californicus]|nr:ankyrin repeat and SOCS box protein 12-like isoform X3 [Tigriopus californicus]